ncbi:hypothetical protein AC579_2449 [Pseudocercospora musae]|uniref:F-box domain-containing protein n=1 Tax=Pseudocercospora musae TaxID=113226 RepID=A0A139IHL7_9PEZI|nr:hypothetical protein AC579_2449 [Pseudocercospora musae]
MQVVWMSLVPNPNLSEDIDILRWHLNSWPSSLGAPASILIAVKMSAANCPNGSRLNQVYTQVVSTMMQRPLATPIDSSVLEELGTEISKQIQTLSGYLRAERRNQPSFERDTPSHVLPTDAPAEVKLARELLMHHAVRLSQLASGPSEYLWRTVIGCQYAECLKWLNHFKIFELVPLDGEIAYSELSEQAHVLEDRLKTIARMAMTSGLFAEPRSGYMAHSATSAALQSNRDLKVQMNWYTKLLMPPLASTAAAHDKWATSTAPNKTPFNLAFQTDLSLFDYISRTAEMQASFGQLMEALTRDPKNSLDHLANSFEWANLGKATVVDIGGNAGHVSISLASRFPQLNFVVQDQAQVAAEGEQQVRSGNLGARIADRIRFQSHDFFTEQPVKSADVYLLRQICHNWNSDDCVRILSQIVPAMGPNSHVLVAEFILPTPGDMLSVNERFFRLYDINMMVLFNAMERDLAAREGSFQQADRRLKALSLHSQAPSLRKRAMGYSEIICQICGVSFNIARLSSRQECEDGVNAAYSYHSSEQFIDADWYICRGNSGCRAYNSQTGEYKSHWRKKNASSQNDSNNDTAGLATDAEADLEFSSGDEKYEYVITGTDRSTELEHIAGPNCTYNAYSGHYISAEEMRGCRTYQCLIRKPAEWTPAEDDEAFEHSSQFFLSGISDDMDARDMGFRNRLQPHRHNSENIRHGPDTCFFGLEHAEYASMPFHPWCLEVFKRASYVRSGKFDHEGLIGWWQHDGDFDTWHSFPRADDVAARQQQWWEHKRGTEHLAANPLFMPGLPPILRSVVLPSVQDVPLSPGVFSLPSNARLEPSPEDSFGKLPQELILIILSSLPSNDLANLRLTSRAFRQLPGSVFQDLVWREMPWLWEAWADDSTNFYSIWTARRHDQGTATTRTAGDEEDGIPREKMPVPNQLPQHGTDWFKLFCSLNRAIKSGELKGAQNRLRIWTDCQEALRRIEQYREQGEIPVRNHKALLETRLAEHRKRRDEAAARRMAERQAQS